MVNRSVSSNVTLSLKIVGIICLLSFLLDFLFLLFPFQPTNQLWQVSLGRNLVERGIVPMVGLAILLAGDWIENNSDTGRSPGIDLKLPTFILSSVLGLMFLLIFPLHLNNVNQVKGQALARINQEADQLETQVNNQLAQFQTQLGSNDQVKVALDRQRAALKEQLGGQLDELVKDEQKYNQALQNNQIPAEQKELLKQYKTNPKALDDFIAKQTEPNQLAQQRITQVRTQKEQRIKQTQEDASKELRIGVSSLLLSIGFIVIGWTGLRSLGILQGGGGKRKVPAR
jgi:hypothetical protein